MKIKINGTLFNVYAPKFAKYRNDFLFCLTIFTLKIQLYVADLDNIIICGDLKGKTNNPLDQSSNLYL